MSDSNELALTLSNLQDFLPATMSLYDGRLVKNETELFFIAERFSGWEIMERCELSEVQKVEVDESFMGVVVEIHTSGSHWTLKEIPEGISVDQWLNGSAQPISESQSTQEDLRQDEVESSPVIDSRVDVHLEEPIIPVSSPSVQPALEINNESSTKNLVNHVIVYPQSDNPQVNQLRQILMDRPELKSKVRNAVGSHVDPLDEDVLSLFMRRHIQSYLQLRASSGEVLSPFEMFKVVQGQVVANPGGPIFLKILKGFVVMFVILFLLPIVLGVLSAVFSILDIIF